MEDARLVVLNAMDAAARGAVVETRTEMVKAERRAGALGASRCATRRAGRMREIGAKALVNAAGPWVAELMTERLGLPVDAPVRLVKGSHIVVPQPLRRTTAPTSSRTPTAASSSRSPTSSDFTLIGTTDLDYDGDPGRAAHHRGGDRLSLRARRASISAQPVAPADVVWTYAGVRPLYDDGASEAQAATRDYVLKVEGGGDVPPVLNIYGGKITTYRRLAEAALEKLAPISTSSASRGRPARRCPAAISRSTASTPRSRRCRRSARPARRRTRGGSCAPTARAPARSSRACSEPGRLGRDFRRRT